MTGFSYKANGIPIASMACAWLNQMIPHIQQEPL
jgi:hypothetical protein